MCEDWEKTGIIKHKEGMIIWKLTPDEADELADFFEDHKCEEDWGDCDIQRLREAADEARDWLDEMDDDCD